MSRCPRAACAASRRMRYATGAANAAHTGTRASAACSLHSETMLVDVVIPVLLLAAPDPAVVAASADERRALAAEVTAAMMRQNPAVCFEVEHMDDLACWRSVIAWGRFEELSGDDAARGMQLLIDRLRARMVSETARPSHGHGADTKGRHAIVYRIALTEKTGRFERPDAAGTAPR